MKNLLISLFIVSLIGCAGMPGTPGYISKNVSTFDGTTELSMEPAWVCEGWSGCALKFSLYKNTKMPKDDVILIVIVQGAELISRGESLHFKIDGELVNIQAIDQLTDIEAKSGYYGSGMYIPPSNWSSKRYYVKLSFIEKIVNANEVLVKVDLQNKYVEGIFSSDAPTTARSPFKRFLEKMSNL
jgi:hypothetical protein